MDSSNEWKQETFDAFILLELRQSGGELAVIAHQLSHFSSELYHKLFTNDRKKCLHWIRAFVIVKFQCQCHFYKSHLNVEIKVCSSYCQWIQYFHMSHSRMKRTLKWPFDDILTWFLPSLTFVGKNKFKIENELDVIKRPIELVIQYFYHLRFQGFVFLLCLHVKCWSTTRVCLDISSSIVIVDIVARIYQVSSSIYQHLYCEILK